MTDIEDTSRQVTDALAGRARMLAHIGLLALIAAPLGAVAAAAAKFVRTPNAPVIEAVGLTAVVIAAILILLTQANAATLLADARKALDQAIGEIMRAQAARRDFAQKQQEFDAELERLIEIQAVNESARAIFGNVALAGDTPDSLVVIDRLLQTTRTALFGAHGFRANDMHTICVYRKHVLAGSGRVELRCVAQIRETDSALAEARVWPLGIGAAGAAFARREEVVIGDLAAPELRSLLNPQASRPDDDRRYRSIVAEPIWQDAEDGDPWGVVCATSRVPGHFSLEDRKHVEAARVLAGWLTLAVKLCRAKQANRVPAPDNVTALAAAGDGAGFGPGARLIDQESVLKERFRSLAREIAEDDSPAPPEIPTAHANGSV